MQGVKDPHFDSTSRLPLCQVVDLMDWLAPGVRSLAD